MAKILRAFCLIVSIVLTLLVGAVGVVMVGGGFVLFLFAAIDLFASSVPTTDGLSVMFGGAAIAGVGCILLYFSSMMDLFIESVFS